MAGFSGWPVEVAGKSFDFSVAEAHGFSGFPKETDKTFELVVLPATGFSGFPKETSKTFEFEVASSGGGGEGQTTYMPGNVNMPAVFGRGVHFNSPFRLI